MFEHIQIMDDNSEPTYPCPNCGRNFAQQALDRHEPVCRKAAASVKKRKVFDSGKQRATGSDIPLKDIRKVQEEIKKNHGHFKAPNTAWRERHDQFMSTVQSAKGVDYALKTGAPLPPPPKSKIPSDYVQCEYCGRNFNKNSAERHIPFCKEQHMRQVTKGPSGGGSLNKKNAPVSTQRRQPMVASHTNHSFDRDRSGANLRGNISSAVSNAHDPYDDDDRNGRSDYRNGNRNTRSISAGRAPSSNQSRVPVPQRRGISPATRIPSYSRKY